MTDDTGLSDNVIFDYQPFLNQASGATALINLIADRFEREGSAVVTEGTIAGPNGPIQIVTRARVEGSVYQTDFELTSESNFGDATLIFYLDEDAVTIANNLIVLGSPGADDFALLTIALDSNIGVAQTAGYNSAQGARYEGWAADDFPLLVNDIASNTADFSIEGVNNLDVLEGGDSRFPDAPAFGPQDITTAFAFGLVPSASTARVSFALGGSPDAQLPLELTIDVEPEIVTEGLPATFTVNANRAVDDDLPFALDFLGDAIEGTDYIVLQDVFAIPAGESQATIPIETLDDGIEDGMKTLLVELLTGDGYARGEPSTAELQIIDVNAPVAALEAGKQANRDSANVGDSIYFFLDVQNVGAIDAEGVTIVDELPSNLQFDSALNAGGLCEPIASEAGIKLRCEPAPDPIWTCSGDQTVLCELGVSLPPDGMATVVLRTTAIEGGTAVNSILADAENAEPVESASVSVEVSP